MNLETVTATTQTMREADVFAYYKAHSVQHDCEFRLMRSGKRADWPGAIRCQWETLLASILARGKELPAHRRERDRLVNLTRVWLDVSSRFDRREDRPRNGYPMTAATGDTTQNRHRTHLDPATMAEAVA